MVYSFCLSGKTNILKFRDFSFTLHVVIHKTVSEDVKWISLLYYNYFCSATYLI